MDFSRAVKLKTAPSEGNEHHDKALEEIIIEEPVERPSVLEEKTRRSMANDGCARILIPSTNPWVSCGENMM